nr:immunoglobulin light chain junction region [Macaca mulatta]
CAQGTVLPWAF